MESAVLDVLDLSHHILVLFLPSLDPLCLRTDRLVARISLPNNCQIGQCLIELIQLPIGHSPSSKQPQIA